MNSFNTPTIKAAVRAAVADGTLVLNGMLDDADVASRWGVMTKPMLDNMARYSESIFPTLPVSVNVQYNYRSHERFYVVDAIYSQYRWWRTSGNIREYRDKALAVARREGIKVLFGMNILDGGIPNRTSWSCAYGRGTYYPNCRMSPTQVREWGKALGPAGSGLLMWRYDWPSSRRQPTFPLSKTWARRSEACRPRAAGARRRAIHLNQKYQRPGLPAQVVSLANTRLLAIEYVPVHPQCFRDRVSQSKVPLIPRPPIAAESDAKARIHEQLFNPRA
jgi:hypothetical protein